jgi:carbon storage regulator CsrA
VRTHKVQSAPKTLSRHYNVYSIASRSPRIEVRRSWNVRIVTRRPRQTVKIGHDVSVTVLEIRGAQVRIGVAAPSTTLIMRQEILPESRAPDRRPPHREPGAHR